MFATSPFAAIRSAPTDDPVDRARREQGAGRGVGHDPVGMPAWRSSHAVSRAPCRSGPRLVDPDLGEPAGLPGGAQHAAGGAVAAGGERAGVAVRERTVAGSEALGAEPREPAVGFVLVRMTRRASSEQVAVGAASA